MRKTLAFLSILMAGQALAGADSPHYLNASIGAANFAELPSSGSGGLINVGFWVNSSWAVEGGYSYFSSTQYGADVHNSIVDIAARKTFLQQDNFALYGRLGLGYEVDGWSGIAEGAPSCLCRDYSEKHAVVVAGLGATYALNDTLDLQLEYSLFIPSGTTLPGRINAATAGLHYHF